MREQRQRRRRRRGRGERTDNLAWRWSPEDDGVLPVVAVVEASVCYERKKKKLQRRERRWKEKRERVTVAFWWPVGGRNGG
jgi:hypothetical protein